MDFLLDVIIAGTVVACQGRSQLSLKLTYATGKWETV
jgi:hypothetical protein